MQEGIFEIVSSIVVFLILSLLHCVLNARRLNRSRQIILPAISVAYSFAAAIFIIRYFDYIMKPFTTVTDLIQKYVNVNPSAIDVLYINVLLYVVYVLGRIVPVIILVLAFKKKPCFENLLKKFYVFDENCQQWLLLNKWTNLRSLFKGLMLTSIAVTGTVLGVIWYYGPMSSIHAYVLPVFVLLVITESFVFLNGVTEYEYSQLVTGDDSYANRIRNLYIIREIYEKIFAHELLSSETSCDYTAMKPVTDYLEKLDESDKEIDHKIADFFRMNGESNSYDSDYIAATLKLFNGNNIVFYNPFYRDMGKYLILPLLNVLMSNKKCLIITGRASIKFDLIEWVKEILYNYGKIESLWRVRELDFKDSECEVGILGFNQFYNPEVIRSNEVFLKNVGLVIMIEPSLIVNTGQIGLSILADYMQRDDISPVYCFLDRITDGLVDSLSHILQINITEVEAPPVSRNIHTAMAWDADGDYLREKLFEKQSKYMGNGIELAAVAIKNQIPEVDWYSETKVPIKDIKWLAGQYFSTICKYMNLPIQQESLYDRVRFVSNIWSTAKEDYKFIIAEDEFSNMFNTMRVFLSRGDNQTFVNVFSENYLLRDYMRCNSKVFISNPDAIPSIVPDYAKTVRNTLIKLLYLMSTREVYESEVLREFSLVGISNDDANSILNELLEEYFCVNNEILHIRTEERDLLDTSLDEENLYSISGDSFYRHFKKTLKNAFFICEDEDQNNYIDAKLFGHVTQIVLPGQFVVYDGKYYIVHSISSDTGVVLRRASNLYDGRKYYLQIREYNLDRYDNEDIISSKTVMDIELVKIKASFLVNTMGFLELNKNNDLRTARTVRFDNDPSIDEYTRRYHNKTILRIKLPDADTNVLFTIAMLLAETLKSIFPNTWQYIAITTKRPDNVDGILNHLVYAACGEVEDGYIYVFEDSELDLGLLEAIEKNLIKLLEIVTDYLMWHFEKMREPAYADPEPVTPEFPKIDFKRRSRITALLKRVRSIFGIKKEEVQVDSLARAESVKVSPSEDDSLSDAVNKEDGPSEMGHNGEDLSENHAELAEKRDKTTSKQLIVTTEDLSFTIEMEKDDDLTEATDTDDNGTLYESVIHDEVNSELEDNKASSSVDVEEYSPPQEDILEDRDDPEIVAIDGTDIFDESASDEDNEYLEECFIERGIVSGEKSRYQKECYLKFGFNEIDKRLQIHDVLKYLTVRGFSQNSYRKARTRDMMEESMLDLSAVNHCDFCGKPISAVSYDRLNDGRIRCNDCTNSSINTVEDFNHLFKQCRSLMQSFFSINFNVGLSVLTTDAKTVARGFGSVYKPSTEYTSRVLGYAKKTNGKYEICIENGSPRLETIFTMAHELTHIWQYINWKETEIRKLYPTPAHRDLVYEGMAVWTSIQYLYLIGENAYARDKEMIIEARDDIYGIGYKMFRDKYPLIKDSSLVRYSPFEQFPPM